MEVSRVGLPKVVGKRIQTLPELGLVDELRWSSDGVHLVSNDMTDGIKRWSPQNPTEVLDYERDSEKDQLRGMAVSPDGKWVAGGGQDHRITVFSQQTGKKLYSFQHSQPKEGEIGLIHGLYFSPDGQRLLSIASESKEVKMWRLGDHGAELEKSFTQEFSPVEAGFDPTTGDLVVQTVGDLRTYRAGPWTEKGHFENLGGSDMDISDSGLVAINGCGTISVLDLAKGEVVAKNERLNAATMAFVPHSNELFVGGLKENRITSWNPIDSKTWHYQVETTSPIDGVGEIAFSPDGERLAVAFPFGSLKIFGTRDSMADILEQKGKDPLEVDIEMGDDWLLIGDYELSRG